MSDAPSPDPAGRADPAPTGPFPPEFPELVEGLGRKLGNLGGFLILVALVAGFFLVSDLVRGRFPLGPWYAVGAGVLLLLVLVHAVWLVRAGLALNRARGRLRAVDSLMEALRNLNRLFTLSEVAVVLFVLGALVFRVVSWFTG